MGRIKEWNLSSGICTIDRLPKEKADLETGSEATTTEKEYEAVKGHLEKLKKWYAEWQELLAEPG